METAHLGSVYTGPDLFGTGTILVSVSLMFTRDLVDLVRVGSAIWYQMGPLMKVISYGTVPFQFRTGPVWREWIRTAVDPIPKGSEHIRSRVNVALSKFVCKGRLSMMRKQNESTSDQRSWHQNDTPRIRSDTSSPRFCISPANFMHQRKNLECLNCIDSKSLIGLKSLK